MIPKMQKRRKREGDRTAYDFPNFGNVHVLMNHFSVYLIVLFVSGPFRFYKLKATIKSIKIQ